MERIEFNFSGLDLGQRNDHSAIALLDLVENTSNQRDPVSWEFIKTTNFRLRGLHRFPLGTAYTEIPRLVRTAIITPPPGHFGRQINTTLAIDGGGPGLPVIEMIRKEKMPCSILPAIITGAGMGSRLGGGLYSVPRRELVTLLRLALETRKLIFPADLPLRDELKEELMHIDSAGGQTKHDDMAIAIALALWAATKRQPTLLLRKPE
jgi:hypothetical protein